MLLHETSLYAKIMHVFFFLFFAIYSFYFIIRNIYFTNKLSLSLTRCTHTHTQNHIVKFEFARQSSLIILLEVEIKEKLIKVSFFLYNSTKKEEGKK